MEAPSPIMQKEREEKKEEKNHKGAATNSSNSKSKQQADWVSPKTEPGSNPRLGCKPKSRPTYKQQQKGKTNSKQITNDQSHNDMGSRKYQVMASKANN